MSEVVKDEQSINKKIKDFSKYVMAFRVFVERSTELEQMMYAVLCKEHILLKGSPGTAKSAMSIKFLQGIVGSRLYKNQFTAFMDEGYVFGPQIIDELKKGNIVHNTKGSLVDSHFAFLDEFFNANEELIISCNEILNERSFTRNKQAEVSPLITAIMTTNQSREDERKLKPIYDRVMFVSKVMRVVDRNNRSIMYRNAVEGKMEITATFKLEDLLDIHKYISESNIRVGDEIYVAFDVLLASFQKESNLYISDRKAIKSLLFLRVVALIHGRDAVEFEDLKKLKLVWTVSNDVALSTIFDAVFIKTKKTYGGIKKEAVMLKDIENKMANAQTKLHNATSYTDFKGLKTIMESLRNSITRTRASYTNNNKAEPKKLATAERNASLILDTVKDKLADLRSQSGATDVEPDDFDWFKNMKDNEDEPKSNLDDLL